MVRRKRRRLLLKKGGSVCLKKSLKKGKPISLQNRSRSNVSFATLRFTLTSSMAFTSVRTVAASGGQGQRTPSTGLLHFGVTSSDTKEAYRSLVAGAGLREGKDRII